MMRLELSQADKAVRPPTLFFFFKIFFDYLESLEILYMFQGEVFFLCKNMLLGFDRDCIESMDFL